MTLAIPFCSARVRCLPIVLSNVCLAGEERTQKETQSATCFMSAQASRVPEFITSVLCIELSATEAPDESQNIMDSFIGKEPPRRPHLSDEIPAPQQGRGRGADRSGQEQPPQSARRAPDPHLRPLDAAVAYYPGQRFTLYKGILVIRERVPKESP